MPLVDLSLHLFPQFVRQLDAFTAGDLLIRMVDRCSQSLTFLTRLKQIHGIFNGLIYGGITTALDLTPGQWRLFVRDLARRRTGTINSFALHITSSN